MTAAASALAAVPTTHRASTTAAASLGASSRGHRGGASDASESRIVDVAGCSSCPWEIPARGTDGTCGLVDDERECAEGDGAPDWCPLRSRDVLVRLSTEAT